MPSMAVSIPTRDVMPMATINAVRIERNKLACTDRIPSLTFSAISIYIENSLSKLSILHYTKRIILMKGFSRLQTVLYRVNSSGFYISYVFIQPECKLETKLTRFN